MNEIIKTAGDFQLLDLTTHSPKIRGKNRILCIAYRDDEILLYWRKGKNIYSRNLQHREYPNLITRRRVDELSQLIRLAHEILNEGH